MTWLQMNLDACLGWHQQSGRILNIPNYVKCDSVKFNKNYKKVKDLNLQGRKMSNNRGSRNKKYLTQDLYEDMTNTLNLHSIDLISNAKIL